MRHVYILIILVSVWTYIINHPDDVDRWLIALGKKKDTKSTQSNEPKPAFTTTPTHPSVSDTSKSASLSNPLSNSPSSLPSSLKSDDAIDKPDGKSENQPSNLIKEVLEPDNNQKESKVDSRYSTHPMRHLSTLEWEVSYNHSTNNSNNSSHSNNSSKKHKNKK